MFNYILSLVIHSDSLLSSNAVLSKSASSLRGVVMKFEVIPAVQRKPDIHFSRGKKKNPIALLLV